MQHISTFAFFLAFLAVQVQPQIVNNILNGVFGSGRPTWYPVSRTPTWEPENLILMQQMNPCTSMKKPCPNGYLCFPEPQKSGNVFPKCYRRSPTTTTTPEPERQACLHDEDCTAPETCESVAWLDTFPNLHGPRHCIRVD